MIRNRTILRTVLALCSVGIILLGLNVCLGGIQTLGWQGDGAFLTIADPDLFALRDSNVRFLGGVWVGAGLTMTAGAYALDRLRPALIAVAGMIFVGGLARLSGDSTVITGAALAPSLALELAFFPLLGLWIARS